MYFFPFKCKKYEEKRKGRRWCKADGLGKEFVRIQAS
jgi:hypothetical protein